MTTTLNQRYSKAAAGRILGQNPSKIDIQVDDEKYGPKVVWVHVKGDRPMFMSRSVFDRHFHEWRWEQGKGLYVQPNGDNCWVVINAQRTTPTLYLLEGRSDMITCTCEDFNQQLEQHGIGRCKHGCAVLQSLGFGSLNDYRKAWRNGTYPGSLPEAA